MAGSDWFTLESVRNSLIRQEDTIVFSLIERAKYPITPLLYDSNSPVVDGIPGSLLESIVKETEAIQAKVSIPGRASFLPDSLPESLVAPPRCPPVLIPAAASININKTIWDIYINKLLPLFAREGQDENYASIAACDLACLQPKEHFKNLLVCHETIMKLWAQNNNNGF